MDMDVARLMRLHSCHRELINNSTVFHMPGGNGAEWTAQPLTGSIEKEI
jgi:hypothetical protein